MPAGLLVTFTRRAVGTAHVMLFWLAGQTPKAKAQTGQTSELRVVYDGAAHLELSYRSFQCIEGRAQVWRSGMLLLRGDACSAIPARGPTVSTVIALEV